MFGTSRVLLCCPRHREAVAAYRQLLRPLLQNASACHGNNQRDSDTSTAGAGATFPRLDDASQQHQQTSPPSSEQPSSSTSTSFTATQQQQQPLPIGILLAADRPSIPLEELRGVQRLFYHFAQCHHPDQHPSTTTTAGTGLAPQTEGGSSSSSSEMVQGNAAYETLRGCTPAERRAALSELFPHVRAASVVPPTAVPQQQQQQTVGYRPFKPNPLKTAEDEAFDAFLQRLDGTDLLRFHRPFVTSEGRRMRGARSDDPYVQQVLREYAASGIMSYGSIFGGETPTTKPRGNPNQPDTGVGDGPRPSSSSSPTNESATRGEEAAMMGGTMMRDVYGVSREFAEAHRSFSGRARREAEPRGGGSNSSGSTQQQPHHQQDGMDGTTRGIVVGAVVMAMLAYSMVMWIFTKGAVKKVRQQL